MHYKTDWDICEYIRNLKMKSALFYHHIAECLVGLMFGELQN